MTVGEALCDAWFAFGLLWLVGSALAISRAAELLRKGDVRAADATADAYSYAWIGLVVCSVAVAARFWPW